MNLHPHVPRILIDHGSAANCGDTAMLAGVIAAYSNHGDLSTTVIERTGFNNEALIGLNVNFVPALPTQSWASSNCLHGRPFVWRFADWWGSEGAPQVGLAL